MRIDEEILERYVRYPHTLTEDQHKIVQSLLEESELAQQIVAFYEEYYRELDEIDRKESASVKSFVETILKTIQNSPNLL